MILSNDNPTPEELIARARAAIPSLRARQEAAERNRQIPQANIDEMLDAGLYRVLQPKRYGGMEYGLDTFVKLGAEIGAGCGSTGWVFTTSAQHQWQIGMYPAAAQDDVWGANPRALAASSYAPTGMAVMTDGGYRCTGRWGFCSGVDVAQWMILGTQIATAKDEKPHDGGYILVPKSDFTIDDTWRVLGLRATGSKDVILSEVFVPAHRMLTIAQALSGSPPGAEVNTGDLTKIPFFAAISICLCAALLGMGRGAIAEFVAAFKAKPPPGGLTQTFEVRAGEAASSVEAAIALVVADCQGIMATIAAGRKLSDAQRARNKGDLGFATRLVARAADLLFESAGYAGLDREPYFHRMWRDIQAGTKHISMNFDMTASLHGRVALGLPAGTAQF